MKLTSHIIPRLLAGLCAAAAFSAGGLRAATHTYTVTSTSDSGSGSLRSAIILANAASETGPNGDEYVIDFGFSFSTDYSITVASPLPLIENSLTIDGTTQNGFNGRPLIEIKGAAGNNFDGFKVHNGIFTVRGLTINGFGGYGISAAPQAANAHDHPHAGLIMTACQIGTNAAGTAAVPNALGGIRLRNSYASQIGGYGATEGNVISGNGGTGLYIDTAGAVTILNNKIGTNRAGTAALPNNGFGVDFDCSFYLITVGGPGAGRNIISGNTDDGIRFWRAPFGAVVRNNIIGLGADGITDLGNGGHGLSSEAIGIEIGGPAVSDGNVISGNAGHGINLFHYFYTTQEGDSALCRNNLIGTDITGTLARGNTAGGILVDLYDITNNGVPPTGNPDVLVKIGASGAGNVISGNGGSGITLSDTNAQILGNLIGVTRAVAPLGNASSGVRISNSNATVGQAPSLGNANIIGANGSNGILVTGASVLTAQGNYIGCTATGADVGNGGDGIQHGPWIGSGTQGASSIGGTGAGMGNSIAYNNGDGVYITEPFGIGANYLSILGNSIWANSELGIDLGADGVTANDAGDVDLGANHRQNFPVLSAATPTKVLGSLSSTPNAQFRIEFFRAEPDATFHGEGRYYLGAETIRTDAAGNAQFGLLGQSLTAGQSVTATASLIGAHPDFQVSDLLIQDTSEFSLNITVGNEVSSVGFQVRTATVGEAAGSTTVTLVRSGVTSNSATVTYTALSGTAVVGSDLPITTGTVTFAAGQTQRTITVPITNDTIYEGDQHFYLRLSNPVNTMLQSPSEMTVLISDNDAPPVISVPATFSVVEGHTGSKLIQIPVTLSAPTDLPVTLYLYSVFGNTALFGENADYYYGPNYPGFGEHIVFAPGETMHTADYVVYGDTTVEPDEHFGLNIAVTGNATLGNDITNIIILNDDDANAGTLQFSAANFSAAENDGSATITVSRVGGTGGAVSVNYALVGGTAVLGADYLAANTSGTLNFIHGQSSASFNITLVNDYLPEGPETMQFQFLGIAGATPGVPTFTTLTITDSDAPGALQFSAAGYSAAENGGTATITVSRVGGSDGPASVSYSRTGGTATVGSDFLAANTSGTLNFAHGQTSASFNISLVDDYLAESPETLNFQLSGATGATMGSLATTTLTITDSDAPGALRFSSANYSAAENAGSATITVTRVGGTDGAASVSYARTGGTATVGSDFLAGTTSGTLNFAHGQASASFTITLLDDFAIEGPETLTLQLSGATGATLGSPADATLTLADNETGFSITGRVVTAEGTGIPGALVILTGSQNAWLTTDATGNYKFVGVVGGLNYLVQVSADGWTFATASHDYQNLGGTQTGQDFLGAPEVLPELTMTRLLNGSVLLSWPASAVGWTLMSSPTLQSGSWLPVTAPVTQRGGYNQVILSAAARAFFRLDRPVSGGGGGEEM